MMRCKIWGGIICGGALYHLSAPWLGLTASWHDWWDAIYWSGIALAWHWAVTPQKEELIVKSYPIIR